MIGVICNLARCSTRSAVFGCSSSLRIIIGNLYLPRVIDFLRSVVDYLEYPSLLLYTIHKFSYFFSSECPLVILNSHLSHLLYYRLSEGVSIFVGRCHIALRDPSFSRSLICTRFETHTQLAYNCLCLFFLLRRCRFFREWPVTRVIQLVTSKPSDVGT